MEELHLSSFMRSFRTERISSLVKNLLERNYLEVRELVEETEQKFPIVLTRDIDEARAWTRKQARGS
ncbi:MAG: hypothetical protein ACI8Z1_003436 [Candidatus Azotimanducaceae bacterium]|jgi:hypothetical protein